MVEIEKKWFGDKTLCPDSESLLTPKNLGLASFWGLFLIVAIAGAVAFTIYMFRFLLENRSVIERSDAQSTMWSKTLELLKNLNMNEREDNNNGCCNRHCMADPSPNGNHHQSPSNNISRPSAPSSPNEDQTSDSTRRIASDYIYNTGDRAC